MPMEKKELKDLNIIDNFLFHEMITYGEKGEEFARLLLETILNRKMGKISIETEKIINGRGTGQHGIRMDVYVSSYEGENDEAKIYDIEPNLYRCKSEERRTRYYHALVDSKILKTGEDYDTLQDVIVIMILPYDPFGLNRMVYTCKKVCMEEPDMPYEDGARTIYLYTRGTEGNPRQELSDMLKYIEKSVSSNVRDEVTAKMAALAEEVKLQEKVGVSYMKMWECEKMWREDGISQGEDKLSVLLTWLFENGRDAEAKIALSDRKVREDLYNEYEKAMNIEKKACYDS